MSLKILSVPKYRKIFLMKIKRTIAKLYVGVSCMIAKNTVCAPSKGGYHQPEENEDVASLARKRFQKTRK